MYLCTRPDFFFPEEEKNTTDVYLPVGSTPVPGSAVPVEVFKLADIFSALAQTSLDTDLVTAHWSIRTYDNVPYVYELDGAKKIDFTDLAAFLWQHDCISYSFEFREADDGFEEFKDILLHPDVEVPLSGMKYGMTACGGGFATYYKRPEDDSDSDSEI